MADRFGLELIREIYLKDIVRKSDALVALLHWKLLTWDLRCVGKGDHFGGDEEIPATELLPPGWQESGQTLYTLKYRHAVNKVSKFVLKIVRVDVEDPLGTFEIVLARISDEETRSISIQTEEVFDQGLNAKDEGALIAEFEDKILKQLLAKKEEKEKPQRDVLLVSEARPRPAYQPSAGPELPQSQDPFSGIGGSDLDPFGRIGSGGMLADPFQPRGGGRGGFPGPRFDPPGPGFPQGPRLPRGRGGNGGGRRNFGDELPPPGYDDMFM